MSRFDVHLLPGLRHEEAMAAAHAEHHAGPGRGKALGDPFDDSAGVGLTVLQFTSD